MWLHRTPNTPVDDAFSFFYSPIRDEDETGGVGDALLRQWREGGSRVVFYFCWCVTEWGNPTLSLSLSTPPLCEWWYTGEGREVAVGTGGLSQEGRGVPL